MLTQIPYLFTYKPSYFFHKFGLESTKNIPNKGVWLIAESLIDIFLSQMLRTYGNVTQILWSACNQVKINETQ